MALNYVSLTVDLFDGQGFPVSGGTVTFTPSVQLTDATDHEIITQAQVSVYPKSTGSAVVSLLATDNAGPLPAGWAWNVSFTGVPGNPAPFSFFLPYSGGAAQNLSALSPVSSVTTMAAFMPLPSGTALGGKSPVATGNGQGSSWGFPASWAYAFYDDFETGDLSYWATLNGTPVVSTAAAWDGTYGALFNVAGAACGLGSGTGKWAQGIYPVGLVRMRFNLVSLTPGSNAAVCTLQNALQTDNFDFFHDDATGTFHFDLKGTQGRDTGIAPVLGHWYDLRALVNFGATTYTARVWLDGVDLGGLLSSTGETASTVRSLLVGNSGGTETYVMHADDIGVDCH